MLSVYSMGVALPERIRVKLSSEQAGAIALTPVVVEMLTPDALVEIIVAVTGKDAERIRELLARGTLVRGATRYRWEGVEGEAGEIARLLERYPDPDPGRKFEPELCGKVLLRGPRLEIVLSREDAEKRGLFQRRSFWEAVMEAAGAPRYAGYHYGERTDLFESTLTPAGAETIRAAAGLVRYRTFEERLRNATVTSVLFYAARA